MQRSFELKDGQSSKFWKITQRGKTTKVVYGRIGTDGQKRNKDFESPQKAKDATDKLISEKIKKGYMEIVGKPKKKSTKTKSSSASKTVAKNKPAKKTIKASSKSVKSIKEIPKGTKLELIGMLAPDGLGGGSSDGQAKAWMYSSKLAAWRTIDGPAIEEPVVLFQKNIGERKLGSLMKQVGVLNIFKVQVKIPDRKQNRGSWPMIELIKFGDKVKDAKLQKIKSRLLLPISHNDRTFGKLLLDRQFDWFEGDIKNGKTPMSICFYTNEVEVLEQMIEFVKPLWSKRATWFKNWKKKVYTLKGDLVKSWLEEEDSSKMTEREFYKYLGDPVSLSVHQEGRKFRYELGGYSEELFGDHGVDLNGTRIDRLSE